MFYLYGITDTKLKTKKEKKGVKKHITVPPIKYRTIDLLERPEKYDRDTCPIQFRVTPATLVEQCVSVVDKLPLPSIYEWNDKNIRLWICRLGYPQYMRTFRVNMIWGRKLLLLDADALSAMNIKDFDHIKHITNSIRMLFHFELTKFSHSISLPDEKPNELYLLWHTQTGLNYDAVRRSDLYRRMQLIRERSPNLDHWDMLDMWLRRERERKYSELIALVPRYKLYTCKETPADSTSQTISETGKELVGLVPHYNIYSFSKRTRLDVLHQANCMPPCDCFWTMQDISLPWRLHCLGVAKPTGTITKSKWLAHENNCADCVPPCECHWLSRHYLTGTVLTCLKKHFPVKFAPTFDSGHDTQVPPGMIECWTRFSI
ncbi:uncharacterized protein LOC115766210 [Drosophila novamexicana]|uniref:uncharacterized protein LOC115766210 n=1 Tax=Drosophila novamexicana TaxID=47314 RepID=UPI0011E5FE71|nr:uncharacterized protein LOC115766210 [Drosophila novamexicana]